MAGLVPWVRDPTDASRGCYLSPVHTRSNVETTHNNVEATFDFVEATFGLCCQKNGNSVERVHRKISFFFDRVECCFDIVAVSLSNNAEATFDFDAGFGNIVEQVFVKFRPFDKVETN